MKKQVAAFAVLFAGVGVLTFILLRAEGIIQQQQRTLKELTAQVDTLRRTSDSFASQIVSGQKEKLETTSLIERAKSLYQSGKYEQAQTILKDVLHRDSGNGAAHYYLGLINDALAAGSRTLQQIPNQTPNQTVIPGVPPSEVPDGWLPFQFNGVTYYRIPLALQK